MKILVGLILFLFTGLLVWVLHKMFLCGYSLFEKGAQNEKA